MELFPVPPNNNRLGFHYFPDTVHYRESDLMAWLPELHSLGASWLTLVAPPDRAIPDVFVQGLLSSGIEPVLHFHLPLDKPLPVQDLRLLFSTYARWGVHYAALFDRPNTRSAWQASTWAQSNLVERFLDLYLPLAEASLQAGLIPIFPPLEPGGDYWDTAFLRAALKGLQRRASKKLIDSLVLGAYAWTGNHSPNWGAGGPERWPGARPYFTPANSEDQRGFRIFDWYITLAKAVLGQACPIMILAGGSRPGDNNDTRLPTTDEKIHAQRTIAIAALMMDMDCDASTAVTGPGDSGLLESVPAEVMACNYWLLSTSPDSAFIQHSWYKPDGQCLLAVGALRQWLADHSNKTVKQPVQTFEVHSMRSNVIEHSLPTTPKSNFNFDGRSIAHYLLLPAYEWGVADWHLEVIRPFVKKYRPTVGFSPEEACLARRVTVVGGPQSFPESVLDELLSAGCVVEQISGDGTSIASQLAAL